MFTRLKVMLARMVVCLAACASVATAQDVLPFSPTPSDSQAGVTIESSTYNIHPDSNPRAQFHHVNDIVPTIYQVLDIQPPQVVNGVPQDELDGVSMAYTFGDAQAQGRKSTQFFDIMASRDGYQNGWSASARRPREPWVGGILPGIREWSPLTDTWELYHIDEDWSQGRLMCPNRQTACFMRLQDSPEA
jgi:arylsulfatase A-like enzyme